MKVSVVLAVVAALVSLTAAREQSYHQNPSLRDWPCPVDEDVLPCVCSHDENLNLRLDCSLATENRLLENALQATFPFKHFVELKIVQNGTANLNMVTEGIFNDLDFKRIVITGTKITTIHDSLFTYSHANLTHLDLGNNMIDDFGFESVKSYVKLQTLILDDNKITTLQPMESETLETFSISGNTQLVFNAEVFQGVPNLMTLNMASITRNSIPQNLFSPLTRIEFINMEENELTELNEFAVNPPYQTIKSLSFGANHISDIIKNPITGLRSDATVELNHNKVTLLTEEKWRPIFDQVPDGEVNLTGNDLKCGCDMAWIFLDPTNTYLSILNEYTQCFDGTQVIYLDAMFFHYQCVQKDGVWVEKEGM